MTADIAHWLDRALGVGPEFWLRLQVCVDLLDPERESRKAQAKVGRLPGAAP